MGFEDLGDLSELDEIPPFEEDISLPGFEEPEGGGISRTFKILLAVMVLAVIAVVAALVYFLFQNEEGLSEFDRTATGIAIANATEVGRYNATRTAQAIALDATSTALAIYDQHQTETAVAFATGQVQTSTSVAATESAQGTAEARSAQQTATAAAQSGTATAEYTLRHTLSGQLVGADQNPVQGIPLRLYRDNGDAIFVPGDETPASEGELAADTPPAGGAADTGAPVEPVQRINVGETVTGTLEEGGTTQWVFSGAAGDSVNIFAVPDDPAQVIVVLLLAPDESVVNPVSTIDENGATYNLPADGQYTISLTGTTGSGAYVLEVSSALEGTAEPPENTGALPSVRLNGIQLIGMSYLPASNSVRQGTPVPTETLTPDEFIGLITTNPDGTFNFGLVPPGTYFLVVNLDELTPVQREQLGVPTGTGTVVLLVEIPLLEGEPITFSIVTTPTATIDPASIAQTATAKARGTVVTVSPTRTQTGTPATATPTASALPKAGLGFDSGGGLGGSSGLTVLVIAAVGLVAVVFVARKLRTGQVQGRG